MVGHFTGQAGALVLQETKVPMVASVVLGASAQQAEAVPRVHLDRVMSAATGQAVSSGVVMAEVERAVRQAEL